MAIESNLEPDTDRPECSSMYKNSKGSFLCSFFVEGQTDFRSAKATCAKFNARLPVILNSTDNENILKQKVLC